MSWIIPEDKFDDQQREFVNNVDIKRENIWIKGFPGSGKSVLLAHTIRRVRSADKSARILVVVFTHSLIKMFVAAFNEMGVSVDIVTFYDFMKSNDKYDYIFSDEVQDLTPSVLKAMKSRAKHVIVAGDSNQSIFDMDPKFREATVCPNEINSLLSSSEFELNIIHRLSSSIINVVQKFLPRMNIFAAKRDLNRVSTQVRLCEATSTKEEIQYIMMEAKKSVRIRESAAILIPTQKSIMDFVQNVLKEEGKSEWNVVTNQYGRTDYNKLNRYFESCGIPIQYVGNGYGDFSEESNKITIMTYHSAKGLDFDNVFLPFLNNSLFIVSDESLSKVLFMVAMTRSRKNLYLTYCGYKSQYLNNFAADCNSISIHDALSDKVKIEGNNIFAGF